MRRRGHRVHARYVARCDNVNGVSPRVSPSLRGLHQAHIKTTQESRVPWPCSEQLGDRVVDAEDHGDPQSLLCEDGGNRRHQVLRRNGVEVHEVWPVDIESVVQLGHDTCRLEARPHYPSPPEGRGGDAGNPCQSSSVGRRDRGAVMLVARSEVLGTQDQRWHLPRVQQGRRLRRDSVARRPWALADDDKGSRRQCTTRPRLRRAGSRGPFAGSGSAGVHGVRSPPIGVFHIHRRIAVAVRPSDAEQ